MKIDLAHTSVIRQIHRTARNPPNVSSEDVASYIAEMSDELGRLAQSKDLTFLSSLLDLATIEAKRTLETAER